MDEKKPRDGCVGDVWHGLMGEDYSKKLVDLLRPCVKNGRPAGRERSDSAILIDGTYAFPVQVLLKKEEKDFSFQSIVPRFVSEYENLFFEVQKIDVWANALEATLEGFIFEGHSLSFYCVNYLEHKDANFFGKKIPVNVSVVARSGGILPVKDRIIVPDSGPNKGKEFHLHNMRYLNPRRGSDPEICTFFFPIQDIKKLRFLETDLYVIKGVLTNSEEGKDYFYNVYIHPSLVENESELKIGEPFCGWGWLQGEIR